MLAACLSLVPHGNVPLVKVLPGQLWTCHVAGAEADTMSGPEMYSQRGDSSPSTGWTQTMTVIWICSRSTTCEELRTVPQWFPRYYVYDKDFDRDGPAFVDEWATGICG